MIEATENIDLVTMRRQGDLEASQREYQARLESPGSQPAAAESENLVIGVPAAETAPATRPPDAPPAINPLTALRLSVVAALFLGLLLIALRQRRKRL